VTVQPNVSASAPEERRQTVMPAALENRRAEVPTVLAVEGLDAGYGPSSVLHGVTLKVCRGEIVVLLGANGAGKTTLMRSVVGALKSRGRRLVSDTELRGGSPSQVARLGVASVPQGRGTFNELSVLDNLRLGALLLPSGRRQEAVENWLERFPRLAERRHISAGLLSGGEQQLLAIARACITEPLVLLCDEPSLGLSPAMTHQIFDAFRELNETLDLSVLIVEQNARLALSVASYAYVLETGRIVWEGVPTSLDADSALAAAYLGQQDIEQ